MIDRYAFGQIVIDNQIYTSDIIIYPDGHVMDNWWRDQGHQLAPADITSLIATAPAVIVAGTGNSGLMTPTKTLEAFLADRGIELIARPSREAMTIFNDLAQRRKTGGCFHLTC